MRLACAWLAAAFAGLGAHAGDLPPSVNCTISVTAIRCPSQTAPGSSRFQGCRQPGDVWQLLRGSPKAKLLYHSIRTLSCLEAGAVDFVALERRPVVFIGAGAATNAVRDYGMNLHLHVRQESVAEQPLFILDWDGAWSDSPQLLIKWESLAVRAFNAASKIPGLAYQKTEEDDDGFVDTGHGTDISGFFKRKPKKAPAAEAAIPGEPDYLADTQFEITPLAGQCVTGQGGLIIARQPLGPAPSSDELFLIINMR